jgi:hypothetical protein
MASVQTPLSMRERRLTDVTSNDAPRFLIRHMSAIASTPDAHWHD